MNDTPPHVERRVHARNLLREMRTRAGVLSDLEIMALINMLEGILSQRASSGRVDGAASAQDDQPEPSGAVPAGGCPPWSNA